MKYTGINLEAVPRLAVRAKEAAAAIGVSEWTIYREIKSGNIARTRLNTITIEELQRYLRDETEKARGQRTGG